MFNVAQYFAQYIGVNDGIVITGAPSGKTYSFVGYDALPVDTQDRVYLSKWRTPKIKNDGCDNCSGGGVKVIYLDDEWCLYQRQDLQLYREFWIKHYNIS